MFLDLWPFLPTEAFHEYGCGLYSNNALGHRISLVVTRGRVVMWLKVPADVLQGTVEIGRKYLNSLNR
jgi:hypothetical protein